MPSDSWLRFLQWPMWAHLWLRDSLGLRYLEPSHLWCCLPEEINLFFSLFSFYFFTSSVLELKTNDSLLTSTSSLCLLFIIFIIPLFWSVPAVETLQSPNTKYKVKLIDVQASLWWLNVFKFYTKQNLYWWTYLDFQSPFLIVQWDYYYKKSSGNFMSFALVLTTYISKRWKAV